MTAETAIRRVLSKIDAAWRRKEFDGLEQCFHEQAQIVGPDDVEYAAGRSKCAQSYREFATNASVIDYIEEGHQLRVWVYGRLYVPMANDLQTRKRCQARKGNGPTCVAARIGRLASDVEIH